jgi:transposase
MITREDDVDIHALRRQGWTITAIANHVGRDRKTVRDYLNGKRKPGVRKRAVDPFAPFLDYVTARLGEDPHLWGITLFDELQALGFEASYPTLTRETRDRRLRPVCAACGRATERPNAIIPHPAGEETQWDWLDLPDPPAAWGWGSMAHLLVGSLAHSGRWRGYLSPVMDQPHLVEGLDRVCRGLGGLTRRWRFDRMTTVCHPGSGRITATFSGVAKHYGVMIKICPPRAGHRKGVVEKVNHGAAQRWWRTLADEMTAEQAQADCDRFASLRGDTRMRRSHSGDRRASVATVAAREPLRPAPPAAYPLPLTESRQVSRQALVAYRGNFYSVPPELAATTVTVSRLIGAQFCDIATSTGIVVARHRLAPDGAGAVVRDHGHVAALDAAALNAAAAARGPHRRKERIPPGPAARAAADVLRGAEQPNQLFTLSPVIDLAAYERAAHGRNTLT